MLRVAPVARMASLCEYDRSCCAVDMSLAMGFSARTCLPAARAASMNCGCVTMGSAMMTALMSGRWSREE